MDIKVFGPTRLVSRIHQIKAKVLANRLHSEFLLWMLRRCDLMECGAVRLILLNVFPKCFLESSHRLRQWYQLFSLLYIIVMEEAPSRMISVLMTANLLQTALRRPHNEGVHYWSQNKPKAFELFALLVPFPDAISGFNINLAKLSFYQLVI